MANCCDFLALALGDWDVISLHILAFNRKLFSSALHSWTFRISSSLVWLLTFWRKISVCRFFLTLLIMSVWFINKGVKIDPPKHIIKRFLGWRFCTGGSTPKVFPWNTALTVGPWEWGTLGMADPGDRGPWEWRTLGWGTQTKFTYLITLWISIIQQNFIQIG